MLSEISTCFYLLESACHTLSVKAWDCVLVFPKTCIEIIESLLEKDRNKCWAAFSKSSSESLEWKRETQLPGIVLYFSYGFCDAVLSRKRPEKLRERPQLAGLEQCMPGGV